MQWLTMCPDRFMVGLVELAADSGKAGHRSVLCQGRARIMP